MKNTDKKSDSANLRHKAEEVLEKESAKTVSKLSEAEILKLVHELKVQQIELQLQNEELILAISDAQDAITLYDYAPAGYYILSKEGEIIKLNIVAAKMLGKERLYCIKSSFGFFVTGETRSIFNTFFDNVFQNKTLNSCDVTMLTNNGVQTYVNLTGIVSENGEQCYITAVNVSERKQAEKRLIIANNELLFQNEEKEKRAAELIVANKELLFQNEEKEKRAAELIIANKELLFQNEEKEKRAAELNIANTELAFQNVEKERRAAEYQVLFDSSPDGVILVNGSGEIINCNLQMHSLFGYTKEELLGKSIESLIPDRFRDHQALRSNYTTKPKAQSMAFDVQLFAKRKDGTEFSVEITLSPIQAVTGLKIIATVRDITEKKKLEQQFLRIQRMESVGTLAGGIAHDLNNILGPIILALQFLRKNFTDKQSVNLLEMLESSAHRGASLVKQVLTFARGQEGERTPVQLRHTINELKKFTHEAFSSDVIVQVDISKDLWPINADPSQIHQVLLNLAVNSRDAMPHGGTITIKADNLTLDEHYAAMNLDAKPGPYVIVSFTDSGTGILPEIQEKIFEPFFTTKETGKGTGLGLATVFSIIKSHRGFIKLSSEIGRGTTFSLYFPAIIGEEMKVLHTHNLESLEGNGECILLVDDEYVIREVTKLALESNGYTVILAADGIEAVALFAQHRDTIDYVITDMNMPNMNGNMLIRTLQKMKPSLPIIGASGITDKSTLAEIGDLNISAFLSKPYTAEILLKTIIDLPRKQ